MRVLLVGDDNFTFAQCMLDNVGQWRSKLRTASGGVIAEDEVFQLELTSCLSESKIPFEFKNNHDKLKLRNVPIHYCANPALLRQYFPTIKTGLSPAGTTIASLPPGPPYDVVVHLLPGLQYEGAPRFIERTCPLFQLRIHLYWFAIAKSSTIITQQDGMICYVWVDQEHDQVIQQLPFPLIDIEKLGPFCKITRSITEDFPLNLTWGSYKTVWKPLIHNAELWHFPSYLEKMKVYVFRNTPTLPPPNSNPDDYNLLKIPQSICQWNRQVLSHVNELFHFNMRTSTPGEMLQISKLSVKYDPRINGWRNMGTPAAVPKKQQTAPQCESWSTLLNKTQFSVGNAQTSLPASTNVVGPPINSPPTVLPPMSNPGGPSVLASGHGPVIEDRPWYATDAPASLPSATAGGSVDHKSGINSRIDTSQIPPYATTPSLYGNPTGGAPVETGVASLSDPYALPPSLSNTGLYDSVYGAPMPASAAPVAYDPYSSWDAYSSWDKLSGATGGAPGKNRNRRGSGPFSK